MSSRRRDNRSWEREDRDRDKYSRGGRSSYRGEEGRRRSSRSRSPRRSDRDRRDHRDSTRRDDRRERDSRRRDDSPPRRRDDSRDRDRERDRDPSRREAPPAKESPSIPKPGPSSEPEAGEAMQDDEDAMMAMMGMAGFGSTKGKHVDGNQEGTVSIKKTRTWRQYMNRRGGFNRPLDKIK